VQDEGYDVILPNVINRQNIQLHIVSPFDSQLRSLGVCEVGAGVGKLAVVYDVDELSDVVMQRCVEDVLSQQLVSVPVVRRCVLEQ